MAFPDVCYARPTFQIQAIAFLRRFLFYFNSVACFPSFFLLIWEQHFSQRVNPQLFVSLPPSVFTTENPDVVNTVAE